MSASVRHASGADWAICRALLPDACAASTGFASGLIGIRQSDRKAIGAAVVDFDDNDAWVSLEIVPPARRAGFGSLLMRQALELAGQKGARRVIVRCDTVTQCAAGPFLLENGFQETAPFTGYEADLHASLPVLRRTRDRLIASGRVPSSVQVTTVPNAPQTEVAQLFAEYIANRADLADAPVGLGTDVERWRISPVILVDGRVKAALLFEITGDLAIVPGRMVAREFQGTWANAVMLGMAADLLAATPVRRFQFTAPPGNTDTHKLARRTGARVISRKAKFIRELQ